MLRVNTAPGQPLRIDIELNVPAVYLDHSVIVDFATEKSEQGQRFLALMQQSQGTLYLSWAHLIELFGLGQGPTFEKTRNYLKQFGGQFILINNDSGVVIDREVRLKPGMQNPAIDEDFMQVLGRNWDGLSPISPATLIDAMVSEDGLAEEFKRLQESHRAGLKAMFDAEREKCKTDSNARNSRKNAVYGYKTGDSPTYKVQLELIRESILTNEVFNQSDGLDLEHAIVSLSYCGFVVYDKKWARRCRKVDLPPGSAQIYDGTQTDDLLT